MALSKSPSIVFSSAEQFSNTFTLSYVYVKKSSPEFINSGEDFNLGKTVIDSQFPLSPSPDS